MKYVLDASVALKWEIPEADSDKANRLRDEFRQGLHDLIAPDFFPQELAHGLTRAERQGRIAIGNAALFWSDAMTTPPVFHSVFLLTPRAIDISSAMRIGAYDCLYVALAEREGCTFLTADDKLFKNLAATFPFIVLLATLP